MFLTRDKNSLGKVCLWIDIKREDLYLRQSDGNWAVANKCVPRVMEIFDADYGQVFEGIVPGKGCIYEISRLKFEIIDK